MLSSRSEFLAGVRAELPLLLGVIPFGVIYGVVAIGAGIPASAAQAMSAIVFAGSSQFVAAQLVGVNTPALIVILTITIVNLRHVLYSASIAPYLQKVKPLWKWVLAYLLTDEAYAVSITHYQLYEAAGIVEEPKSDPRHWYFLGAGLALWSTWQVSTAVGIFIGAEVPGSWSLDFTIALTFIALVVPNLRDRATVGAAFVAGVTSLLAFTMPHKLGLVIAALVGIAAGLWLERIK